MMPKPVSPGGVPIWISGTLNDRVLGRLARFGAGWIPWGADLADLSVSISRMREGVAARGRDPEGIGVVGSLPFAPHQSGRVDGEAVMAPVPGLVAAGVTDVRLFMPMPASGAELADQLGPLVSAFRAVVAS
jgi:hypothetical protein